MKQYGILSMWRTSECSLCSEKEWRWMSKYILFHGMHGWFFSTDVIIDNISKCLAFEKTNSFSLRSKH